jgi:hypothetical protein
VHDFDFKHDGAEPGLPIMSTATILNQHCDCASPAADPLAAFHSQTPVFIDAGEARAMAAVIAAVHEVTSLRAWQEAALDAAPAIARIDPRTSGVFAGFDFHLTPAGPRLIEINTNAGGAMINAVADWRYPACCTAPDANMTLPPPRAALENSFLTMFAAEWRLARGALPCRTIAIVDDEPDRQFLSPEFELFAQLFRRAGFEAFVADARELEYAGRVLSHRGRRIDLVYNRTTDFHFEEPAHDALRLAYEHDAAVITPHPRAHAMLADKRLLCRLSDAGYLQSLRVPDATLRTLLEGIPRTRLVAGESEAWWTDRKRWFFKPAAGFGSRGAYRGDKITRRVFEEVMRGGYVAQEFAAPSERLHRPSGASGALKLDLRHYVYDGQPLLRAARLYQGQTTNFRTPGGGFAPVIELHDAAAAAALLRQCPDKVDAR